MSVPPPPPFIVYIQGQSDLLWADWWNTNRLFHLQFREAVSFTTTNTLTSGETIPISATTLTTLSREVFISCLKENKNPIIRAIAALGLGKLNDKSVIPVLKEVLNSDKDGDVRNTVAFSLAMLEDEETVNNFIELARDKNAKLSKLVDRANTILMLGYLKNNKAIEALKDALDPSKEWDKEIQCIVLMALANYRDKSVVPFICNILSNGARDLNVRSYAAIALGIIREPDALPDLKKALRNKDSDIRSSAALALGFIKSPDAKNDLIELINSEDNQRVKAYAILALAQSGDKSVCPFILNILKRNDYYFQGVSALALGLLGDERALPELHKTVEKKNKLSYEPAILALGLLKDKTAIPAITQIVEKESFDKTDWSYAIQALGMIGDAKSVPVLNKVFNDTRETCALSTEEYTDLLIALTMLGKRKEVLPFLNQQITDNTLAYGLKLPALHGVSYIGDKDSIKPLLKFYADEKNKDLQLYVIQSLVLLLEKEKITCYCRMIAHGNFNLRHLLLEYIFYK